MEKININTKRITEFTTEDTIYIKDMKDERKPLYLCQFIKYEKDKVFGKILEVDKGLGNEHFMKDKVISASLSHCGLYGQAKEDGRIYFRFFNWATSRAMHPLEEELVEENNMHVKKHPSYGLARFSRQSSSHNKALFGSSIGSNQTITFSISRAEHERSLNNDWYYGREELIEIEMTQNQFAELITSMNMGSGIPCTIKHVLRDAYPDPPFQSKFDIFHGEFTNMMKNVATNVKQTVAETMEILKNKNSIGKADRETILKGIQSLMQELESNVPFVAKQFQESMETTVTEAKSHIEAFIDNKIRTSGMEALGYKKEEHTPQIEMKQNDKKE